MCSKKKKDLEIVCNLEWKTKCFNNGGERSNIVGVYDVPSTTLNWETFKSYLLKNSGTPGDDVSVSYVTSNDKELAIRSQAEFQVALYHFRKKARNGEIINLKLDRISDDYDEHHSLKRSSSNDVQTQFDAGRMLHLPSSDQAPEWFAAYMKQFKKEMIDEMSALVSAHFSMWKDQTMRKVKTTTQLRNEASNVAVRVQQESGKRRKNEKEFQKTLKMEKKVDLKLESLQNRTKRLKEKKTSLLLLSKLKGEQKKRLPDVVLDDDDEEEEDDVAKMNAAPVRSQQTVVPHMIGGEVYLHTWEVINNGLSAWSSDTELRFTWGSALLEPVQKVVPCPPLKPKECGTINVLLNVPKMHGRYESYWHFHHKGRKFGHWLGCQIIVDKINSAEPLTDSFLSSYSQLKSRYEQPPKNVDQCSKITSSSSSDSGEDEGSRGSEIERKSAIFYNNNNNSRHNEIEKLILNASPSKIQIVEGPVAESTMGRNNASLNKCDGSSTEKASGNGGFLGRKLDFDERKITTEDGYEITRIETQDENETVDGAENEDNVISSSLMILSSRVTSSSESISKIEMEDETSSNSTLNDIVLVNLGGEEMGDVDEEGGFAYVSVDGAKVPVPKRYLRSDYLETAEDAPDPTTTTTESQVAEKASLSTEASGERGRKFGFPRNCPGYKVTENEQPHRASEEDDDGPNPFASSTLLPHQCEAVVTPLKGTTTTATMTNNFVHLPNYQQMLPEMRHLKSEPECLNRSAEDAHSDAIETEKIGGGGGSDHRDEPDTTTPASVVGGKGRNSPNTSANVQMSAMVNGAMTMASTALSTAKNVVNLIIPNRNEPESAAGGVWTNGHWVTTNANSNREANLKKLTEMGFWDRDLNATLLARYNDDIWLVVADLIH